MLAIRTLLLVALARCEWVEISQTYRKPIATRNYEIKPYPSESPRVNTSVASDYLKYNEHPWTKGNVYRVQHLGTVRRVQPENTVKTTPTEQKHDIINDNKTKTERTKEAIESKNKIKIEKSTPKINKSENHHTKDEGSPSSPEYEEPETRREETVFKENRFEDVLRFVKAVSGTITKNAHKSVRSKLHYLHELRDSLLYGIEAKIEETWPDDDKGGRQVRSAPLSEQRGHVEFPSSEGALMTISFLTFAVFLIKLVLQVIQTYKNKTMMMTPAVVAVSKSATSIPKYLPKGSRKEPLW